MKQLYKWGGVIISLLFLVSFMAGCKSNDDDDDTPSATSYTVTVATAEHGSVTANPTSATAGTNVILSVTPADGYQLKTLTVTKAGGGEVETTPDNSTPPKYKFTMPASNVTVTATFTEFSAEENQAAANAVIEKINAIGTVAYTTECKALIDAARTAYNALTSAQKALVTNYTTLTAAEGKYAELTPASSDTTINLSTLTESVVVQNGFTITGSLAGASSPRITVSIADGATVILDNANINDNGYWSMASNKGLTNGLKCLGDATIILKDGSDNTIKACDYGYSAIFVPDGKTLTIKGGTEGTGKLTASVVNDTEASSAGIGAGSGTKGVTPCGNIVIEGGIITAKGGAFAAGIGGADGANCGNITITGGTVYACGGHGGVGIGGAVGASCGNITIADTVTKVTAEKNVYDTNVDQNPNRMAEYSIGAGKVGAEQYDGTCGTITIGGNVIENGITESPYVYEPGAVSLALDLSNIPTSALESDGVSLIITDGMTISGTLPTSLKISIADGATVTLDGITINAEGSITEGAFAGLTCLGDATIILKDGTTNSVQGFAEGYSGISVPEGKTLTIKGGTAGTGSLTAKGAKFGYGTGIGGNYDMNCGNIEIQGGVITANGGAGCAAIGSNKQKTCGTITISGGTVTAAGGAQAAGIGTGNGGTCGNILISGGTVEASSYSYGAGIGSGYNGTCGTITIANTVTKVTATKGNQATNSIGAGNGGSVGTVTIGGVEGAISTSPYTYTPPVPVSVSYKEGSWNATAERVDFETKTASAVEIANDFSGTITSGWYAVKGDNVVINDNVTPSGDINIILCDGAKLTINGQIRTEASQYGISIYGQEAGTGKLTVINSSSRFQAIYASNDRDIKIHGGEITAQVTNEQNGSQAVSAGGIWMYGGKLTATSVYTGILFLNNGFQVYGGEVIATSNNISDCYYGINSSSSLIVYSGKVKATGGRYSPNNALRCKVKSGVDGIKFYFADTEAGLATADGTIYLEATDAPSNKYAKVE